VRVLDGLADGDKKREALGRREPGVIAVGGDRRSLHELYDEERPAGARGAGVVDSGDMRMIHQG
jgi:hypothetical protein